MRTTPRLNISTLIFILIFLAGIIGIGMYINKSFTVNDAPQTHFTPQDEVTSLS